MCQSLLKGIINAVNRAVTVQYCSGVPRGGQRGARAPGAALGGR